MTGLCGRASPSDNAELQQLVDDDQALRHGDTHVPNDAVRLARVLALYHGDSIRTAADFSNASLILQHGQRPEHYLLAREFTTVSLGLGCSGLQRDFMVQATTYRLLSSLGLNPEFLIDVTRSGMDQSDGFTTMPGPPAFHAFPLTMALLTQRQALLERLRAIHQQHPEYPWQVLKGGGPSDSLSVFVARTPEVAALFTQANITVPRWDSLADAVHGAIDYSYFQPVAPRPMASVTSPLGFSSVGKNNIEFVLAHQTELRRLGYAVDLMDPDTSELSRAHLVSVQLPPDTLTAAWHDPCPSAPTPSGAPVDNPELVRMIAQVSHANLSIASTQSVQLLTLFQTHAIRTARDSMRAAIVSEHEAEPEDLLRAYNLATALVNVCGTPALQLAAASEDRFLVLLGLKQRFGTLSPTLAPVDSGAASITDITRRLFKLPVSSNRKSG